MTVRIDLAGPNANVAALMNLVFYLGGRIEGYTDAQIDAIKTQMVNCSLGEALIVLEQAFPKLQFEFVGDPRKDGADI